MDEITFRVGDEVLVSPWNQDDYIAKIGHVTPKGYVQLEGRIGRYHTKYDNYGNKIPHEMTGGNIRPATEADRKRIAHRNRINALKRVKWELFTEEQIEQLYSGLQKVHKHNKALAAAEEQKKLEAPKE